MEIPEKKLFTLEKIDRPEVSLPPQNQNKNFEKVDTDAMKRVGDEFKVAVQIYKFNMTKQPVYFNKLVDFFDGVMDGSRILNLLHFLSDWGIVEGQYGDLGNGRAGRLYYIDSGEVWRIREIYEEHVKPYERPEDQISYVPGLMIEK